MGRRPKPSVSGIFSACPAILQLIISLILIIVGIVLYFQDDFIKHYIGIALLIFGGIGFIWSIFSFIGEKEEKKRLIAEAEEEEKYKQKLLKANISDIDNMDGQEFEEFLGALFEKQGYTVMLTQYVGDYGADLVIDKDDIRIAIQAKRYSNKVSISAIQEIVSAKTYYGATYAWVITNNYFTKPAQNLALTNEVTLIDRDKLIDLILEVNNNVNI